MTHLPAKQATVEQMRAGVFPFLNPYASFGEPLAGNPNFGTFFPDMFAFLVLPLSSAFGLRFALAAVLAYAGARRWARAEGASRGAAEVAAIAFALSGVYVSTWRFFNSGLALALAPWVMAAAARVSIRAGDAAPRRRRAVAELALVSGLEILAGEPVIALMSFGLAGLRALMGPARRRALLGGPGGVRPRRRDRRAADREHRAGVRDLHPEPRAVPVPARLEHVADAGAPAGAGRAVSVRAARPDRRGRLHRPRAPRQPRAVSLDAARRLGRDRRPAPGRAAARPRRALVVASPRAGGGPLVRPVPCRGRSGCTRSCPSTAACASP